MITKKKLLADDILDIGDLATRWNYKSREAVYKRMGLDKAFPPPMKKIYGKYSIWRREDIERYEELRDMRNPNHYKFHRYHTYEEYLKLTDEEKEYHNGNKWKKIDFSNKYLDQIALLEKELNKAKKELKAARKFNDSLKIQLEKSKKNNAA